MLPLGKRLDQGARWLNPLPSRNSTQNSRVSVQCTPPRANGVCPGRVNDFRGKKTSCLPPSARARSKWRDATNRHTPAAAVVLCRAHTHTHTHTHALSL
ncbi:hypothetical protein CCHR01_09682 [Colletotrichum chrysophilum]|uniref:Uncharacterized protein n=1 Tax=Colletotrichum chrysophilum TaxID=1836956 RepID=A0AAD9AHX6_9PEZI|nr:hypothetical protein CCHR01_09682 [Colletotrichum chrysophilum]